MTGRLPPFVVHVAASPAGELQRCVACGTTLPVGSEWWPAGALVATDREPNGRDPSMTYAVDKLSPLDEDEQPCSSPTR